MSKAIFTLIVECELEDLEEIKEIVSHASGFGLVKKAELKTDKPVVIDIAKL